MPDANKAVFLSYARDDAAAARRIAEALRASGLEVWFDENELRGGDAWDAKIRQQINDCTLFLPIISRHTQERGKGYFRLEWKLAVEQTHLMAEGMVFLAPVVIDDTPESGAVVPPEFMKVQWTRLPGALPTPPFVGQVKRLLERKPVEAGRSRPAVGASLDDAHGRPQGMPLQKKSIPGWIWGAATAVVVGISVALYVSRQPAPPPSIAASASEPKPVTAVPALTDKSIAVLAFADLSEAHSSEYLSDGISEELLNALAKIPGLGVAARTSAFSFKGKNLPIPEIAQKLNVAYVVEGSVQRAGDRVKITAQLIKAADGFHVWSDTFTRDLKDVFAVEEEISALIAKNLSLKLGIAIAAPTASAAPTKNPAAYEAYLRGRAAQTAGFSERTSADAMGYYESAVRLDPDYALAWARLAELGARIVGSGFDRSSGQQDKARTAAATALRLDANLPEAHLAQARVHLVIDHDLAQALRGLDIVEQLRPGEVEVAAVRVQIAYTSGQWGDTISSLAARAVEADPQNVDNLVAISQFLSSAGHFAEAYRLCEQAAAAGDNGEETIRQKHNILYTWTGDAAAALALLETMPARLRETNMRFYYSRALYRSRLGQPEDAISDYVHARAIAAAQFANRSGPRGVAILALYRMAQLEARLGHPARSTELETDVLAEVEKFRRDFPDLLGFPNYGAYVLARRGQAAEANAIMDESDRLAADHYDFGTILSQRRSKAVVFALLGRNADAIAELRAVHEAGYGFGYSLRTSDDYEPLRSDPRFQQLMKEAEARADAQPRPKK
jgi:TolB-like protein